MKKPDTDTLPPDPDDMNDQRAEWAEIALRAFMAQTRCDIEEALQDLLCDLRHWADRAGQDWDQALEGAMSGYDEETYSDDDEEEEEDSNAV